MNIYFQNPKKTFFRKNNQKKNFYSKFIIQNLLKYEMKLLAEKHKNLLQLLDVLGI